jgi:hypothetical protein
MGFLLLDDEAFQEGVYSIGVIDEANFAKYAVPRLSQPWALAIPCRYG